MPESRPPMHGHKSYPNIVIQPVIDILNSPSGGKEHLAGPIYPDFQNQGYARHTRARGPVDDCPPMPQASAIEALDEDFVYGGCLVKHFGHFIAEFIHRILPSAAVYPTLRIIFVGGIGSSQNPLPGFADDIFAYFGIGERVLLVDKPVRVRCLHVFPQEEYLGGPPPRPAYLQALKALQDQRLKPLPAAGSTLFVSRSKQRHCFAGEYVLDQLFAALGAAVFYPEKHTVLHQLNTYLGYRRIIFSEGSALHGLQLLGRLDAEITILLRHGAGLGTNFLASRIDGLDFVSLREGMVHGYTATGGPALWTGIVFLSQRKLKDFCGGYFTEIAPAALRGTLDAFAGRFRAAEYDALLGLLNANHTHPLWKRREEIVRQIASLNRYNFRGILACAAALEGDTGNAGRPDRAQTLDGLTFHNSDDAADWLDTMVDLEAHAVEAAYGTGMGVHPEPRWHLSNPDALRLMFDLARPGAGKFAVIFNNADALFEVADLTANTGLFLRATFLRTALPDRFSYRSDAPPVTAAWLDELRGAETALWRKLALCLFVFLPGFESKEGDFAFLWRHIRWLSEHGERDYVEELFRHSPIFDRDGFERRVEGLKDAFWEWKGSEGFVQDIWPLYHISPRDHRIALTLSRVYVNRGTPLQALCFALMASLSSGDPETTAHLARMLMFSDPHLETALNLWRHLRQAQPKNQDYNSRLLETVERMCDLSGAMPARPEMLTPDDPEHVENFADALDASWLDVTTQRLRLCFQLVSLFRKTKIISLCLADISGRFEVPLSDIRQVPSSWVGEKHPDIPWSHESRFILDETVPLPERVATLYLQAKCDDGARRLLGEIHISCHEGSPEPSAS